MDLATLKKLKVAELKELCVKNNLPVSGKKDDLISRLHETFVKSTSTSTSLVHHMAKSPTGKGQITTSLSPSKTKSANLLDADEEILEEPLLDADADDQLFELEKIPELLDDNQKVNKKLNATTTKTSTITSKGHSPSDKATSTTRANGGEAKTGNIHSTSLRKPNPTTTTSTTTVVTSSNNRTIPSTDGAIKSLSSPDLNLIDQILSELSYINEQDSSPASNVVSSARDLKRRVKRAQKFNQPLTEADRRIWRDLRFRLLSSSADTSTTTLESKHQASVKQAKPGSKLVTGNKILTSAVASTTKSTVLPSQKSAGANPSSSMMDPEILLARRRKFGIEDDETKLLEMLVQRKKQKS